MPINISGSALLNTAAGGAAGASGSLANTNGPLGVFAALLNLVQSIETGTQNPNGNAQRSSASSFNISLGDLQSEGSTDSVLKDLFAQISAALTSGEKDDDTLSALSELLGVELQESEASTEFDPDSPLAGLIGQLSSLLNDLAAQIENTANPPAELTGRANAAQRIAEALIRHFGAGGNADAGPDLASAAPQSMTNAGSGAGASANGEALSPASLRALAADLGLIRHGIDIPGARAQAEAVFNGQAPTLEELLQPKGNNTYGQNQLPGTDPRADQTRLADTLGANIAARAGAEGNKPAAPGLPSAEASLAASLASQNANTAATPGSQTDPFLTAQITQTGAPVTSADGTAAARPMQAAYQTPQVNLPNIAFEITRQFHAGNNRFQIRLDPPELGRIDVRMDVDAQGAVHARLAVDRAETLDMLQRDARALERALQQAGLDSNKTNLEFSLRQNAFAGGQFGQDTGDGQPGAGLPVGDGADGQEEEPSIPAQISNVYRGTASPGGVNLFV